MLSRKDTPPADMKMLEFPPRGRTVRLSFEGGVTREVSVDELADASGFFDRLSDPELGLDRRLEANSHGRFALSEMPDARVFDAPMSFHKDGRISDGPVCRLDTIRSADYYMFHRFLRFLDDLTLVSESWGPPSDITFGYDVVLPYFYDATIDGKSLKRLAEFIINMLNGGDAIPAIVKFVESDILVGGSYPELFPSEGPYVPLDPSSLLRSPLPVFGQHGLCESHFFAHTRRCVDAGIPVVIVFLVRGVYLRIWAKPRIGMLSIAKARVSSMCRLCRIYTHARSREMRLLMRVGLMPIEVAFAQRLRARAPWNRWLS